MIKKQWQSADDEYEAALSLRENALGDHPLVASTLLSLSQALRKLKRRNEARVDAARAEKITSLPSNATFTSNSTIDVRALRAGN